MDNKSHHPGDRDGARTSSREEKAPKGTKRHQKGPKGTKREAEIVMETVHVERGRADAAQSPTRREAGGGGMYPGGQQVVKHAAFVRPLNVVHGEQPGGRQGGVRGVVFPGSYCSKISGGSSRSHEEESVEYGGTTQNVNPARN